MTAGDLRECLATKKDNLDPELEKALAPGTRTTHRQVLEIVRCLVERCDPRIPASVAVYEALNNQRIARKWVPTTFSSRLGAAMGAFDRIPEYYVCPYPVKLTQCPTFRDYARRAEFMKIGWDVKFPKAAPVDAVRRAIDALWDTNQTDALLLLLMWSTAARVGCVQSLRRRDVRLASNDDLTITFVKGKIGKLRNQPYSVPTLLGPLWAQRLRDYLNNIPEGVEHVFHYASPQEKDAARKRMRDALRAQLPELEMRSLRRGAIQALAAQGATTEVLMNLSGHRRKETLYRYLGWNTAHTKLGEDTRAMAQIALVI